MVRAVGAEPPSPLALSLTVKNPFFYALPINSENISEH